eukprot:1302726-Pyramimonas_sp.AAC.1
MPRRRIGDRGPRATARVGDGAPMAAMEGRLGGRCAPACRRRARGDARRRRPPQRLGRPRGLLT